MTSATPYSVEEPFSNAKLQGGKSEDEKLELGNPEKVEWDISSLREGQLENLKVGGGVDPVFEAKAAVLNSAIQRIGMGKYQWKLFVLCGFGWVRLSSFIQIPLRIVQLFNVFC
jgi:hypothetical protein